jgi:UDP-2,4-diacetamido-2,4,6-trideoxy-beta-L-altropyranose hydrolase
VLAIDDMAHLARYPVDLLLNQNLSATAVLYHGKTPAGTDLLLGPRYSLLRREFRAAHAPRRSPGNRVRRVLVSFGGGDAPNLTAFVLQRLASSHAARLEVVVLAGAANPHVADLRALAERTPFPCRIVVNAEDVAEHMTWADVAIAAAGSTVWEMASLRLPALVAAIEDNQIAGVHALADVPFFRTGLVEDLLTWNLAQEMEDLLHRGAADRVTDIDANGALRVVDAMLHLPAVAR